MHNVNNYNKQQAFQNLICKDIMEKNVNAVVYNLSSQIFLSFYLP